MGAFLAALCSILMLGVAVAGAALLAGVLVWVLLLGIRYLVKGI